MRRDDVLAIQNAEYHPAQDLWTRLGSTRDFANLFLGPQLGHGYTRWVYPLQFNISEQSITPEPCVVKFEPGGDRFQNVIEWHVWNWVKGTPAEKWFAPCVDISPNGTWLIQRRITKLAPDKYPKKIPAWFADTKYENFGLYKKHFVAADYGTMGFPFLNHKLKTVRWWHADDPAGGN